MPLDPESESEQGLKSIRNPEPESELESESEQCHHNSRTPDTGGYFAPFVFSRYLTNALADRHQIFSIPSKDVRFELTCIAPGPRRALFVGPNVRLLGSCWAQHERHNAKGIYRRARC